MLVGHVTVGKSQELDVCVEAWFCQIRSHISCNMGMRDFPNMYTHSPWALGIHIRQIPHAHVATVTSIL